MSSLDATTAVLAALSFDRDGLVAAVTVERSSGSELLDGAVRRMLEKARVPPFPPGMAQETREETLRVGFTLQ